MKIIQISDNSAFDLYRIIIKIVDNIIKMKKIIASAMYPRAIQSELVLANIMNKRAIKNPIPGIIV